MSIFSKSIEKLSKSIDSLTKNTDRRLIRAQTQMTGPDYGKEINDRANQIKTNANPPKEDLETKVRKRYKLEKEDEIMDEDPMKSQHSHHLAELTTTLLDELHRRRNVTPTNAPLHKSHSDRLFKEEGEEKKKKKKEYSPRYKILTAQASNPKTAKGEDLPYMSALLHLAPHTLAGCGNVCPAASKGCVSACLNTSGRGGMIKKDTGTNTVQQARIRRTKEFHEDPSSFWKKMNYDIHMLKNTAKFDGKKPAMRLNGTSDLSWEDYRPPELEGKNVFEAHPDVQFYDYTKRPERMMRDRPDNYHLTFSRSEANHHMANKLLKRGHNVTVVFGGKEMPTEWNGHPVVSGDDHDFRFLDPKAGEGQGGHIIGLTAKGEGKKDDSGFVVWDHSGNVGDKVAAPKEGEAGDKLARIKSAQDKVEKSNVFPLRKKDDWENDYSGHEFDKESADIIKTVGNKNTRPVRGKLNEAPLPVQKPGTLDYSKMTAPKNDTPIWKQKMDKVNASKKKQAISNAGGTKREGPREIAAQALVDRRKAKAPIKPKTGGSKLGNMVGAMKNHINKKLLGE